MENKVYDFDEIDEYTSIPNEENEDFTGDPLIDGEGTKKVSTTNDFDLDKFLARELGSDVILTGSQDEPIETKLSELTPKQKVALLKYHYTSQNTVQQEEPEFTEDELYVIDALRNEKVQELYERLGERLGVNNEQPSSNFENIDDYIKWKITSDYPDISEYELSEELERFKDSPNLEKKVNRIKEQYQQSVENEQRVQEQQYADQVKEQIVNHAQDISEIYNFELDDEIKNDALRSLLEPSESGTPEFIDFIGTPEGIVQSAMLWRAMPDIKDYVNSLHEQIDKLKKQDNNSKTIVDNYDKMDEDDDSFMKIPTLENFKP